MTEKLTKYHRLLSFSYFPVPRDRITTTHQGYGFAEFQTEVDAEYACKILNGIKLYGKPLRVNKASSDRKQIDIGANLFVGNLDQAVDERILFETFSAFGNVVGLPNVSLKVSGKNGEHILINTFHHVHRLQEMKQLEHLVILDSSHLTPLKLLTQLLKHCLINIFSIDPSRFRML